VAFAYAMGLDTRQKRSDQDFALCCKIDSRTRMWRGGCFLCEMFLGATWGKRCGIYHCILCSKHSLYEIARRIFSTIISVLKDSERKGVLVTSDHIQRYSPCRIKQYRTPSDSRIPTFGVGRARKRSPKLELGQAFPRSGRLSDQ